MHHDPTYPVYQTILNNKIYLYANSYIPLCYIAKTINPHKQYIKHIHQTKRNYTIQKYHSAAKHILSIN